MRGIGVEYPRLSNQRRAFLAAATESYRDQFADSPAVKFLQDRGIPDDVAEKFRLGYVGEPVDGHDRFVGRLAIPYLTPSGVSCIRFRSLEKDPERKFDQEKGVRTALYNVQDLHRSDPWIAVCEGEPDTWVTSGIVGVPAVGIPGVDHWNTNAAIWSKLLQDYDTVFVLTDPDESGQKIVSDICNRVENPRLIDLPADVNDTVNELGADWLLEQMGLM